MLRTSYRLHPAACAGLAGLCRTSSWRAQAHPRLVPTVLLKIATWPENSFFLPKTDPPVPMAALEPSVSGGLGLAGIPGLLCC